MDKDLELLHQKVDFLTEQVMLNQRRQQEWVELRQDLTPVVNDFFRTLVTELDQVAPYFSSDDLLYLLKKMLRNTRQFITLIEQLESASDFIQDATPLSKQVFQLLLENLDQLERKGYFNLVKEALHVLDQLVTTIDPQDLRQVAENVGLIADTIKQLTRAETMRSMRNVLAAYGDLSANPPQKTSVWALLKQLNDPEVRRGLATGMAILRSLSAESDMQAEKAE
ncbi:DUF1641 domain-containing protein [candidate division KSB1 bacterium]|nr:DUF1641 domain-containing protein [candidate division KSB1 bacterium]